VSAENSIQFLRDKYEISDKKAAKLYKKFWSFIEQEIIKSGSVTIGGIGSFSLVLNEAAEKEEYDLVYNPDKKFLKKIGADGVK
jgi:nucleoid DNA-binding protein